MGAFSIASVLGIPAGLELARIGGWRTPFFAVGALCLVVMAMAIRLLPSMRAHLEEAARRAKPDVASGLLPLPKPKMFRGDVILAYISVALSMLGGFMMIPNFSAYFQYNMG